MATAAQTKQIFADLERVDHDFVAKIEPFLEGLYKYYFRCDIQGWDNIPQTKALYVGNHNGLLTFEVLMMFYAYWKHFGNSRKALGLAHSVALNNPFFKWLIPRLGAIPADPDIAIEALKRDYSLLVYPGGEKESFRPFTERKKVDFYQRKGFIKLALKAQVPLVPIVSIGAHESYVILHRGEELAEKLGLKKKFRLHGLPITFRSIFFGWCVATGIFTFFPLLLAPAAFMSIFVPMPAKMDFKILPAIDVVSMLDPNLSEEQNLQKIYDYVLKVMNEELTREYAKRRFPVIG
ncbi:MAG: 1-acyl-sn-glycerol-3-phosphate acyltransferase [Bdellovibrio sp.]|nr:1-acyl-sn-glycerol-3-phosphate acyltransferase [Bdellovibrio sp.]